MRYLYGAFALAVEMSPDHSPELPSLTKGFAVVFHPLKVPGTFTEVASGAQTRKVTPVPNASAYGIDPIPGRLDWAGANAVNPSTQAPAITKQSAGDRPNRLFLRVRPRALVCPGLLQITKRMYRACYFYHHTPLQYSKYTAYLCGFAWLSVPFCFNLQFAIFVFQFSIPALRTMKRSSALCLFALLFGIPCSLAESRVQVPFHFEPFSLTYDYHEVTPVLKHHLQTQLLTARHDLDADLTVNNYLRLIAISGYHSTDFEDRAGSFSAYEE